MIFFDVTKASSARQRSGLIRVSEQLRTALGLAAAPIVWPTWDRAVKRGDWLLTPELFSPEERPGFAEFLEARPCRFAAIFHDAIPLKHPHITWPQSVARHPSYMKLLARFDHVWAVSEASRRDLLEFWRWQGVEKTPPVEVLPLGADFNDAPRVTQRHAPRGLELLCVGILEPRKNQEFILGVCEDLWAEGLDFELHVVGRVNPHFGEPVLARLKQLRRKQRARLIYHEAAGDAELAQLYARARATVFPTIAEGCGLPLLESLWMGVPCVCSDLPVLRENADGGGCLAVALNDRAAWQAALRGVLNDDALYARLAAEAIARPLPAWADAAQILERALQA